MKIKCTNISIDGKTVSTLGAKNDSFTIGKEYIVLTLYASDVHFLRFRIETDDGELIMPSADCFELTSSYMPSNWEIDFITRFRKSKNEHSFYLDLAPRKWNAARYNIGTPQHQGFYEEILEAPTPLYNWKTYDEDEMPPAVRLYLQEKQLIEQEELAYEKSLATGKAIQTGAGLFDLIKAKTKGNKGDTS